MKITGIPEIEKSQKNYRQMKITGKSHGRARYGVLPRVAAPQQRLPELPRTGPRSAGTDTIPKQGLRPQILFGRIKFCQ